MTLDRFHIDGGKVGAFVAGAILAALAYAAGAAYASDGDTIHACVDKKGKVKIVKSDSDCKTPKETLVEWSIAGPQGPTGNDGATGADGDDGAGITSITVGIGPQRTLVFEGTSQDSVAICPGGDKTISGGFDYESADASSPNFKVLDSFRFGDDRWVIKAINDNVLADTDVKFKAVVYCAALGP